MPSQPFNLYDSAVQMIRTEFLKTIGFGLIGAYLTPQANLRALAFERRRADFFFHPPAISLR